MWQSGVGVVTGFMGGMGVLTLVVAMNAIDRTLEKPSSSREVAFDVPQKKKQPSRKARPKRPPKKTPRRPPPPTPALATAVGGLDLGLWAGSAIDLSGATDALLGASQDVIMTAETVDSLPVPTQQSGVPYPPQARNRGIEGQVTLALSFDASGALTNVAIANSDPPGWFEDAATRTVKMWKFRPATYQGRAVPVSGVEITLDFDLER